MLSTPLRGGEGQYDRVEPPPLRGWVSAILASSMVTIQVEVAMITVPVAIVAGLVAMEL